MARQAERATAARGATPVAAQPGESRYLNRELSWLDFNERVLVLAEDEQTPLLERVKFLAIFAANLDEFYQIRVATLRRQEAAAIGARSPDGLTATEQLARISTRVAELAARHAAVFSEHVKPELSAAGIRLLRWGELDENQRAKLTGVFAERIFPVLTPLAVDPGHPFPYISNLSLNLAVSVLDPGSGERRFARLKVPPLLPRFVVMPDGERFVPLEQVIAAHLEALFPGMDIESHD